MIRTVRLLPLLFCLILLAGCAGAMLPVPWPPMPTSVILSPTPRPTIDASARLTATPLPTPMPSLTEQEIYSAALRPQEIAPASTDGLTAYRLDVTVAPDLSLLTGQEHIRYTNRETVPLDTVYLHLYPNLWDGGMTVTDAQVAGRPVTVTYPTGDDAVGLPLDPPLKPGESVDLSMSFAVPIPTGKGVGNYGEFALQDGVLALAHFYPTVAVYDTELAARNPCTLRRRDLPGRQSVRCEADRAGRPDRRRHGRDAGARPAMPMAPLPGGWAAGPCATSTSSPARTTFRSARRWAI